MDHIIPTHAGLDQTFEDLFVATCRNPAPDGTRFRGVRTLMGLLMRRQPLPLCAAEAALHLLETDIKRSLEDGHIVGMLVLGWQAQLEALSRRKLFVLEVVHAWNALRCAPAWPPEHVGLVVEGLWNAHAHSNNARLPRWDAEEGFPPCGYIWRWKDAA